MSKPRLLDLFCCAGGAAMGYHRAGFDVVGVDIRPQPRYPFAFVQADALDVLARMLKGEKFLASDGKRYGLADFDAIHASPPCQEYSDLKSVKKAVYPDLIAPTRKVLASTGKPYIIENVDGAPLQNYVMLCGSMFGLRVQRHRLFECTPPIFFAPFTCNHWGRASGNRHKKGNERLRRTLENFAFLAITGNDYIGAEGKKAMGIDWMIKRELSQAIPPAYTEWLGRQLMERL